jgi:predicted transcriptional regulator
MELIEKLSNKEALKKAKETDTKMFPFLVKLDDEEYKQFRDILNKIITDVYKKSKIDF